jgi:hypothetical protein
VCGRRAVVPNSLAEKDLPANLAKFFNELGSLPKPQKDSRPKHFLQQRVLQIEATDVYSANSSF